MTTDTEALRAKFEAWATAAYGLSFDDDTPLKRYLWAAYQAGHAAAKAENAAAVAAERERCAAVCDRYASALDYSGNAYVRSRECQQAAAAIRAGANGVNSD